MRKYQGLYSSPTVKLLWLSESVKAIYSDCLVRRAITSLTDQDVGSSVIMRSTEHPRIICMGAEVDDCKLSGYIHTYTAAQEAL